MQQPSAITTGSRVAIDASSTVGWRTGIGGATAELLNALCRIWPEAWPPLAAWVNSRRAPLPEGDAWLHDPHCAVHPTRWPGKVIVRGWQHLGWPRIERFTGPADLVHAPASYIPAVQQARRVVTVHDIYFKHAPAHVQPYGGTYFAQTFAKGLPAVEHVIAISRFTRDELLAHYPLAPERVSIVPHGVNRERFNEVPHSDDDTHLQMIGVERPYLLCVATLEPRKNLVTLVEAYARARNILRAGGQKLPRLVIVGMQGWGLKAYAQRLVEARLHEDVLLTGYVAAPLLPALYRHAYGFIMPSLYEGFGMPVLEAMSSGCPALLAEAGALPEVGGDAALYFHPGDSDNIARTLARFISDPTLRGTFRDAGLARSRQFGWDATARGTLEVYQHVLASPPRGR